MSDLVHDATQRNLARAAGLTLLLSLVVPILNWIFVLSRMIVPENPVATARKVLAHEALFRLGIMSDLGIALLAVVVGLFFYKLVKGVQGTLAWLALLLKLLEAGLGTVIALGHVMALWVLKRGSALDADLQESIQAGVGLLVNGHISATLLPGVFLGLSMTLFSFLLFKRNLISGLWTGLGMLSYSFILMYDLTSMLWPQVTALTLIQIGGSTLSVLGYLALGLGLLCLPTQDPKGAIRGKSFAH